MGSGDILDKNVRLCNIGGSSTRTAQVDPT